MGDITRKVLDGEYNHHLKQIKKKAVRAALKKLNTLDPVDAFCLIATGYALAVATWLIFVDSVCR